MLGRVSPPTKDPVHVLGDGIVGRRRELEWLREQYEPYVKGLAERLLLTLPPFYMEKKKKDNWQSSAWKQRTSTTSQQPEFVRQEYHL